MEERPPDDELDRMYRRLLEELEIPESKRSKMMNQPMQMKWRLLCKHQRYVRAQASASGSYRGALRCVEELDRILLGCDRLRSEDIIDLKMELKKDSEWVQAFLEVGGLHKLVRLIQVIQTQQASNEMVLLDVIEVLQKLVLGSSKVLDVILSEVETVVTLVLCFDCSPKFPRLATEILSILIMIAEQGGIVGTNCLRSGFEALRLEREEPMRYFTLLKCLNWEHEAFDISFKTCALNFINCFLRNCEDLDMRVALRTELSYVGLVPILDDFKGVIELFQEEEKNDDEDTEVEVLSSLSSEIEKFWGLANKDMQLMKEKSPHTADVLADPEILFAKVQHTANSAGTFQDLLNILHSLLVCPTDSYLAPRVWSLLSETCHKIVTERDGFRLSFEEMEELYLKGDERYLEIEREVKKRKEVEALLEVAEKKLQETQKRSFPKKGEESNCPKYEKYFKMKKAGLPDPAIKHALVRDNLSSKEKEEVLRELFKERQSVAEADLEVDKQKQPELFETRFEKYVKMRKAGLPDVAIEHKMTQDGLSKEDRVLFFGGEAVNVSSSDLSRKEKVSKLKEKEKITPRKPMKSLFWSRLPETTVEGSIWENLDESLVQIDLEALESKFSKEDENSFSKTKTEITALSSMTMTSIKVEILDPKRLQNVGIAFARLKLSPSKLKECILDFSMKKLGGGVDRVNLLQKMIPTDEEVAALTSFEGDKEQLGKVETLFLELSSISHLSLRIRVWLIQLRFKVLVVEQLEKTQVVIKACEEVRNSSALHELLRVVLAIGNYMNGTSSRGGAYGFKLDFLTKLESLKSSDQKTTMLHFIVKEIAAKKYPHMLKLHKDLANVEGASKINLSNVSGAIKTFENDLVSVKTLLAKLRQEDAEQDLSKMEAFLVSGGKSLTCLKYKLEDACSVYKLSLQTYAAHEDDTFTKNSSAFFHIFDNFLQSFRRIA